MIYVGDTRWRNWWLYAYFYIFFFFQAEDGIRVSSTSRGLGDVYKVQVIAGAGSVGRSVALELLAHGHDITLIDHTPEKLRISSVADADSVPADASSADALRDAVPVPYAHLSLPTIA